MKTLILASLFATAFSASATQLTGESSLTVTKKNGKTVIEKVETRFFEDTYKEQLFKFVAKTISFTDSDGAEQSGTITAYRTQRDLFDTQAWTKEVKGADFSIFNDELVRVNEFGCCDSPTINRLYNRANGGQVEAALNDTTVQFEVPNSNLTRRYLALVIDSRAPAKLGTKTYIGTISYFDGERIKGRVRVYGQLEQGYGAQIFNTAPILDGRNELQNNVVTVWEADGSTDASAAFSNIGLKGSIYLTQVEVNFSVVVNGDQIDASASKGDTGLELVIVR